MCAAVIATTSTASELVKKGNDLCLQCHRAHEYDTCGTSFSQKERARKGKAHQIRRGRGCCSTSAPAPNASSAICRAATIWASITARIIAFEFPVPDLSVKIGTPDACIRCHIDKTVQWSDETITKWYGPGRRQHYGTVIDAGRKRQPAAVHKISSDWPWILFTP